MNLGKGLGGMKSSSYEWKEDTRDWEEKVTRMPYTHTWNCLTTSIIDLQKTDDSKIIYWWEYKMVQPLCKICCQFFKKLVLCDPAIPLLGI